MAEKTLFLHISFELFHLFFRNWKSEKDLNLRRRRYFRIYLLNPSTFFWSWHISSEWNRFCKLKIWKKIYFVEKKLFSHISSEPFHLFLKLKIWTKLTSYGKDVIFAYISPNIPPFFKLKIWKKWYFMEKTIFLNIFSEL